MMNAKYFYLFLGFFMLKNRIISTLRFFDLQDYPLTLLELHKFLIADLPELLKHLDALGEMNLENIGKNLEQPVAIDRILTCLDAECQNEVENHLGFYCFAGRKAIVSLRLENYFYGIQRERLIRRYGWALKHLPFLRGAAIAGSQALGQQKSSSDIDLFIITDPKYLWLARTIVTAYFQIIGKRRHGKKVANRFCLNHYLAGPKNLHQHRDLYNAMEYLRFRPLFGGNYFSEFYSQNLKWLNGYFPNFNNALGQQSDILPIQKILEKLLNNNFGYRLNVFLGGFQLRRIRRGEFVEANTTELAFHSVERKRALLSRFFQLEHEHNREAVEPVA
jgi:hypothetical protein